MSRQHNHVVMCVAICFVSSLSLAQPPGGGKGKGNRGGEGRGGAMGDPAQIATKMMTEFDVNGDMQLQVREFTAALTAQRERREAAGGQGGRRGGEQGARGAGGGQAQRQGRAGQGGQRGGQKAGGAAQRGGRRAKGAGGQQPGAQRGAAQGAQGAARGGRQGDPAQIAAKMLAEFDQNRSGGLDVKELTAALEAQRQNRAKRGGAAGQDGNPGQRRGAEARGQAKGDAAGAGQGQRKGRGDNNKGQRENTEPSNGVVPKRPGT